MTDTAATTSGTVSTLITLTINNDAEYDNNDHNNNNNKNKHCCDPICFIFTQIS